MTVKFEATQNCPAPEGPGLHSYDAASPAPEAAEPGLWTTASEPEPELEAELEP